MPLFLIKITSVNNSYACTDCSLQLNSITQPYYFYCNYAKGSSQNLIKRSNTSRTLSFRTTDNSTQGSKLPKIQESWLHLYAHWTLYHYRLYTIWLKVLFFFFFFVNWSNIFMILYLPILFISHLLQVNLSRTHPEYLILPDTRVRATLPSNTDQKVYCFARLCNLIFELKKQLSHTTPFSPFILTRVFLLLFLFLAYELTTVKFLISD
jgi:hypothetical protein